MENDYFIHRSNVKLSFVSYIHFKYICHVIYLKIKSFFQFKMYAEKTSMTTLLSWHSGKVSDYKVTPWLYTMAIHHGCSFNPHSGKWIIIKIYPQIWQYKMRHISVKWRNSQIVEFRHLTRKVSNLAEKFRTDY